MVGKLHCGSCCGCCEVFLFMHSLSRIAFDAMRMSITRDTIHELRLRKRDCVCSVFSLSLYSYAERQDSDLKERKNPSVHAVMCVYVCSVRC